MVDASPHAGGDSGSVRGRVRRLVDRYQRLDASAAPRSATARGAAPVVAPQLVFTDARVDGGPGAVLAQRMRDEIALMYDGLELDGDTMPKAGPAELSPPAGAFLVGSNGGDVVCCGGLKRLDERTCEIKKMYVVPELRGLGVARALLHALEDKARELGYERARLDTGPKQLRARGLYESEGYTEIPDFNQNPVAAFWGEKDL
jgi:GNAT superfamily N-acetyltransferase